MVSAPAKNMPVPMALDNRAEWFEWFDKAVIEHVALGKTFTADDIRSKSEIPEPGHSGWWGAAFNRAARQGLIRKVGYTESKTKSRNHGVLGRWKPVTKEASNESR